VPLPICALLVEHEVLIIDVTPWHANVQGVLEKFEFFPIKCRIHRTAERYSQYLEEETDDAGKERRKLNTKVMSDTCSAQTCNCCLECPHPSYNNQQQKQEKGKYHDPSIHYPK
jgi:hypothetical protein